MKRSWFALRGLPVSIPTEGRNAGVVEDFYFMLDTCRVYALRVRVGILGTRLLTTNAIRSIERDAVTIASEMMLIEESHGGSYDEMHLGHALIGQEVRNESERSLGKISDIILDTQPVAALRVAELVLDGGRTFSATEVTAQRNDVVYVLDKVAIRSK
jgi:uncharacterized protein YrrD